jgi:hypothetical protein
MEIKELEDRFMALFFRRQLSQWENYIYDFQSLQKQNPVLLLQLLGESMRDDVLELMRWRQCLARKQGNGSYPELVLWSEDLELESVRALLLDQIKQNLPVAIALAKGYGITWPSWFEDLASIGYHSNFSDPMSLVFLVLECFGFERLKTAISVFVKRQPILGYAGILSVPDDIRILVSPVTCLYQELTLYHELGHAIAHALNKEDGLFKTWTSAYYESMAVVVERIVAAIVFDEAQRKAAQDLRVSEATRLWFLEIVLPETAACKVEREYTFAQSC